jgi:hypothetical protein
MLKGEMTNKFEPNNPVFNLFELEVNPHCVNEQTEGCISL